MTTGAEDSTTETPVATAAAQSAGEKNNNAGAPAPATTEPPRSPSLKKMAEDLPKNRFELELEFVQALASPAYLHYLATNPSSDNHNWLDDPEFIEYLRYLHKTWTKPEYNRFLVYPQGLYFLEWLLNHRREEWAQVGFRNFAHQQQFMSWQHRASRLYGRGSTPLQPTIDPGQQHQPPQSGQESVENPQAMQEG